MLGGKLERYNSSSGDSQKRGLAEWFGGRRGRDLDRDLDLDLDLDLDRDRDRDRDRDLVFERERD